MRRSILAILALAAALAAPAQTATKLSASKATDYGIVYSLPNTVLDITIETEYTEQQPGDFYNYANRYLNITNAITKPSRSATVKSITIVPRGEANPANRWLMQLKPGQNAYVMLNGADVPVAINTEKAPQSPKPQLPQAVAAKPTPLETPAAQQALTQEMTMSLNTAKRAQLAAERVFELRENRNDLISGQSDNTPPDGQSMQLALDNLSAQEAALTAMFAGTTKTWTEVETLVFTPDSTDVQQLVIARLSPTEGIVDASDLSGAPLYLSMQVVSRGEMPKDEKGQHRAFPKGGVAYQIPGTAIIEISYEGRTLASRQFEIAQLGFTFGLDPKIFTDKKAPAYVIFDPVTGGIVTLGTAL